MATTTAEERAQAAQMRTGEGGGAGSGAVDRARFPPVEIEMGTQKYVLIQLLTEPTQYLVRGNCDAEYHKDAAEPTLDKLHADGIGYDVLGGGRIQKGASTDGVGKRRRFRGNGQRDQRAGARAMHAGLQQGFELAAHASAKHIKIFGFSYGFPWQGSPRHDIAAELVKCAYPEATVETSNDGY